MGFCLGNTIRTRCGSPRVSAGSMRIAPTGRPTRRTARGCGATPLAQTGRVRAMAVLRCGCMGRLRQFHQTFSSSRILPTAANPACTFRCGETPSRYAVIPDNELGAAAHWKQPLSSGASIAGRGRRARCPHLGSRTDLRRHRRNYAIDDHQRDSGLYAELMAVHREWTVAASGP